MGFKPQSGGGVDFVAGTPEGAILKRVGTQVGEVTAIPESLIVTNHVLSTFSNTAGITELGGTVNNFSLNWTYNRNGDDPTSQTINQGIGSVATNLRTYAVVGAGLTSNTTYNISAIGDDSTASNRNTTVTFRLKRYWGAYDQLITTDAQVLANLSDEEFATSVATTKTFNPSLGNPPNYLYFCYPASFGSPSSTLIGGFTFTDYTQTTIVGFTNASGHSEDYILLRTNPQYSGTSITWQLT